MAYQAGEAIGFYRLDISQPKQAAAELRALFQGIQQQTAVAPQAVIAPPTEGVQAYVASLREAAGATTAAVTPTQSLIESIRAEGIALGQTDEQINAHLAALSREALAIGDVTRALALEEAALGVTSEQDGAGTSATLQRATAEARAAIAARDYGGALRGLASELQQQGERTVGVINAERQLIQIENQATAAATREADARLRVVQADARALAVKKDYAGALALLNGATAAETNASANVLATVGAQAAQYEVAGTAAGAFGAHVGALLNPIVLVTAAVGAGIGAVKSFGDALAFQGKLDESRRAFDGVIGSVIVGNAILDEATQRGKAYGFTQSEVATAFRELSPIIRTSTSDTKAQVEALARFSVLHPEDAVNQLKTAVEGLQSGGRISGIAKDLGLGADEQERLKKAVADGKDVFVALNDVLDRHGITLQSAAERMQGYEGAERRAAQAGEDLKQAQADFAQGPGIAFLEEETRLTTGLSRLLGGSGGLSASFQAIGQNLQQSNTYQLVYNQSIENGATETEAAAAANRAVAQELQATASAASAAAGGVLRSADADDRVAAAAAAARPHVEGLTGALLAQANATALADQRKGEQTGSDLSAGEFNKFADIAAKARADKAAADKKAADKAKQDNAALINSEIGLAGAKKNTAREIELLRQKQAQADRSTVAGQAEYNTIQAQIIGIQTAAGKTRVSAAASTALQLNNVEENSQLQLAKTQREGLERLRDQQQDFDLKRSRSQEDEDRKIQGLLARGQRAAAAREKDDFAREQRRDREDFDIQRRRTLRNNAESTGDIDQRTDLRQSQIGKRAALRGVKGGGLPAGTAPLPVGATGTPDVPRSSAQSAATLTIQGVINIDGKATGTAVWPTIQVLVDQDLAVSLSAVGVPGGGQPAVAGAG